MLQSLHVKNLALIDEIEIQFDEHLNILTGETGAGKSIIIGSIESALGKKVSRDMIRPGQKEALIELLFYTDDEDILGDLREKDLAAEDGMILIKRVISEKRSVNRINDCMVTLKTLQEVAERLMNLHGQQEHQSLLNEKNHKSILDHFLSQNGKQYVKETKTSFEHLQKLLKRQEEFTVDEAQRLREMSFLNHEIQEIEDAQPVKNEDEALDEQYQKMVHSQEIMEGIKKTYECTGNEADISVGTLLSSALKHLQGIVNLDQALGDTYEQLLQAEDIINGFNQQISEYMSSMEFDAEEFARTEERLNLLNSLKDKYGRTIEDVLSYRDKAQEKLLTYEHYEEEKALLLEQTARAEKMFYETAGRLSKERRKAAKILEQQIFKALSDLNFLSVKFQIQVSSSEAANADGIDKVSFLISTNPGLPVRPMAEVASGGELSRIMLAIKSVLADVDQVGTLIFDEIDTGISGETANKVARKMAVIAKDHQVLAITHLPQIAAMADSHYYIEKHADKKKTTTTIQRLSQEDSLRELGRMINGDDLTEAVLKNSKEMKCLANDAKLY
ncbi:DNA repair protein RecN [Anaerostipes sp.]|uniref:DNA repair protein RecN n=1 Tax=Anaerostipes sp. TaxID=1872530 RepID=UPI0025BDE5EA|nr:DNA repair protein RecN [Anaerostipes sp.]MBS7008017.1 DNA repair protein RecN [Anaerostipes sp.]